MKGKYNILVTGSGGDIGQSVGKILLEQEFVANLYGIDITDRNAGKFIYPNFDIGLRYSDPNYISSLKTFIIKHNIDLIIPVSEPELRFFSKENILGNISRAKMVIASKKALEVGFDKLSTSRFLEKNNLPFPITDDISSLRGKIKFPVILKSKTGSGSSQVHIINDIKSFNYIKENNSDFIVQEFIDGNEGEFTCGLFRSSKGEIRTMTLKRELLGGFSGYGEVVDNKSIQELLLSLAVSLELVGSINVQLRITNKGPIVFEINPRFSSTVRFRDLFGYKDLIWSIEDVLNLPISGYTEDSIGRKFYKGFNEFIQ